MLDSKVAAFTCGSPFTTFRPSIQRKHVASSRQIRISSGITSSRIAQPCKHASFSGWSLQNRSRRHSLVLTHAAADPLVPLGLDFLTFLAATVLVIPLFKSVKASPVLGFLFSGLLLGQLGYGTFTTTLLLLRALLTMKQKDTTCINFNPCEHDVYRLFRNIEDIQKLSELGVLFLLFEMGLELSLDRLKASP